MKFEQDEEKNIIDFEHSVDEDRYIAIGKVGDVLFVVFTERKETIRLISARLATNAEKELYYVKEVEEAKKSPINFDEDCGELSPAMMKAFKSAVVQRNRKKKAQKFLGGRALPPNSPKWRMAIPQI